MSSSSRESQHDSSPKPNGRKWLPQNGTARKMVIWGAIMSFSTGAAAFVIAIEKIWPYRPVVAKELEAHSKADARERDAIETRTDEKLKTVVTDTDEKIQSCLDEIRKLREDEKAELKEQNRMLRDAIQRMGGTP